MANYKIDSKRLQNKRLLLAKFFRFNATTAAVVYKASENNTRV